VAKFTLESELEPTFTITIEIYGLVIYVFLQCIIKVKDVIYRSGIWSDAVAVEVDTCFWCRTPEFFMYN
jgi:hypothetical protein